MKMEALIYLWKMIPCLDESESTICEGERSMEKKKIHFSFPPPPLPCTWRALFHPNMNLNPLFNSWHDFLNKV